MNLVKDGLKQRKCKIFQNLNLPKEIGADNMNKKKCRQKIFTSLKSDKSKLKYEELKMFWNDVNKEKERMKQVEKEVQEARARGYLVSPKKIENNNNLKKI